MAESTKYYTKEHEWLQVDGDTGTIGITDHAQRSLGDIVFVDLPRIGQQVTAGSAFGSIESVKAVSDLNAPVSGTVTAVNETLNRAPEAINADADETWLIKLVLANADELNGLLSIADYHKFVGEES